MDNFVPAGNHLLQKQMLLLTGTMNPLHGKTQSKTQGGNSYRNNSNPVRYATNHIIQLKIAVIDVGNLILTLCWTPIDKTRPMFKAIVYPN